VASSKGSKVKNKKASIPPAAPPPVSQWVVVQLTALGEREKNIQLIIRSAHQILARNDLDVFVPAINQKGIDDSLTTWYSEGYVFVQYEPGVSYHKLAETNYFNMVLSSLSSVNGEKKRVYSLLTDKDLSHMRNGMQDLKVTASRFKEDQRVKITKGSYKGLPGRVAMIYDDGEKVQVFVNLRSIKGGGIFMDFPASYLQKDDT
jgi:transcription antitermination factor NusG